MTVALILLTVLTGAGLLLWLHDKYARKEGTNNAATTDSTPAADTHAAGDDGCCGMHITCERDSLLAAVSPEIEYYDDEELDAYRDRDPDTYSEAEVEQFRDVLLTMRPADIAGWARSLQLRHVPLPAEVRDELIMIVAEARRQHRSENVEIS